MAADLVMTAAATVMGTIGTIVSTNDASAAMKAEGENARDIGRWQSAQLKQQAGQERASAQRQAIEERRKGDIAVSRARAVAAASGGGASDPTVMNIYSDLASEGEYNAQAVLAEGEEAARGLESQAGAAEYEGAAAYAGSKYRSSAAKRAGYISSVGHMLQGGADIYAKHGLNSFYEKYAPATELSGNTLQNPAYAGGLGKFGRFSSQVAF